MKCLTSHQLHRLAPECKAHDPLEPTVNHAPGFAGRRFTSQGSGKYFNRRRTMKPAHIAGLEHWVFREAQAMGMLCVYD